MTSDDVGKAVLEKLGLLVRKLPELRDTKRADFIAKRDELTLLVEAKLREDSPDELKRMEKELDTAGVSWSKHRLGNNNSLSDTIRQAVMQLDAEQEEPHDYTVLLLLAVCSNPGVVCEQIADTLYGTTSVQVPKPDRSGVQQIPCYFYRESEFHRASSLDAAIVGFEENGDWALALCLNPFSSRFEKVRASALARMFEGRTVDPIAQEMLGNALIPDKDAPRPSGPQKKLERMFSTMDLMLRHLEKKYGFSPFSLTQGHLHKPMLRLRLPL